MKNYRIPKLFFLFALLVALSVKFGIAQRDLHRGQSDPVGKSNELVPVQYAQVSPVAEITEVDTPAIPDTNDPVPSQPSSGIFAFLVANWLALLIGLGGFIEVIVRLTPTTKDDSILAFIKNIIDSFIPNRRIGGGTH
jgi:hypothetical protein